VRLVDTTATDYYGSGYQDIQTRVPWIENTCKELRWRPTTDMRTALTAIFDAYAHDMQQARDLTTTGAFPTLGEPVPLPAQALTR
jgi:hypothetical protein